MFTKEALETGKASIDCGATKSMGSWEALDGLARLSEQRHGSTRFSLDRTKKTWYTFANGTRQQSEGEVPFKVDAGGRTGECKINCLNTTGGLILLSVHSLSQVGTPELTKLWEREGEARRPPPPHPTSLPLHSPIQKMSVNFVLVFFLFGFFLERAQEETQSRGQLFAHEDMDCFLYFGSFFFLPQ